MLRLLFPRHYLAQDAALAGEQPFPLARELGGENCGSAALISHSLSAASSHSLVPGHSMQNGTLLCREQLWQRMHRLHGPH